MTVPLTERSQYCQSTLAARPVVASWSTWLSGSACHGWLAGWLAAGWLAGLAGLAGSWLDSIQYLAIRIVGCDGE